MDTKIYLVTVGKYSDYRVIGVFSTKEKAEEFIASMKAIRYCYYEDPKIEEFKLDARIQSSEDAYYVKLEYGDVVECENMGNNPHLIEELGSPNFWVPDDCEQEDVMCGYLWAKSREHAVKIATEKWFQYEALGEI